MKLTTTLKDRDDWPELRIKLGALLEQRALDQDLDFAGLASRMGYEPRRIRQLFKGSWRSPDRYQHAARTLGWSLEQAFEVLEGDALEGDALESISRTPPDLEEPASEPVLVEPETLVSRDDESVPLEVSVDTLEQAQPPLEPSSATPSPTPHDSNPMGDMTTKPKPKKKGVKRRSRNSKTSSEGLTFADHRMRLAGELKALIAKSGKSQSTWAKAIGVSQSTVSSVLAGRHKRRSHFDSLARKLGYAINQDFELVERAPKPTPAPRQKRSEPVEEARVEANVPSVVEREVVPVVEPESAPARLRLDPSQEALIEWSAAQRGIEPRIWLTLAVAAYHEAQAGE